MACENVLRRGHVRVQVAQDVGGPYVGDRVYILTSFIEAHNYAQRITIKYLGEKGFVDTEEEAILQESHVPQERTGVAVHYRQ